MRVWYKEQKGGAFLSDWLAQTFIFFSISQSWIFGSFAIFIISINLEDEKDISVKDLRVWFTRNMR